mmetsp:Transcript_28628/g.42326  ORF Transcript_28628/g.42326 Transcript_28628/m.42326 type:complete len:224 (+) Transcript_28628:2121-2792(+)
MKLIFIERYASFADVRVPNRLGSSIRKDRRQVSREMTRYRNGISRSDKSSSFFQAIASPRKEVHWLARVRVNFGNADIVLMPRPPGIFRGSSGRRVGLELGVPDGRAGSGRVGLCKGADEGQFLDVWIGIHHIGIHVGSGHSGSEDKSIGVCSPLRFEACHGASVVGCPFKGRSRASLERIGGDLLRTNARRDEQVGDKKLKGNRRKLHYLDFELFRKPVVLR